MADLDVYMRGPTDGRFTRSLVADLRRIASVEVIYPEEGVGVATSVHAGDELTVRLMSPGALAAEERVRQAIGKWMREPRRPDEVRERLAVIRGPNGDVLSGDKAVNG